MIRVALCGNPNVGKSTLFNRISGGMQHTGNWPGKTIEIKETRIRHAGKEIEIVDLPGTYSLSAHSAEELVARGFLISRKPGCVVQVADSTRLERNLYLTLDLIELGAKPILALNMSDKARERGMMIDEKKLSEAFGIRTIGISAISGEGIGRLKDALLGVERPPEPFKYSESIEKEIGLLSSIAKRRAMEIGLNPRYLAIKLIEDDEEIVRVLSSEDGSGLIDTASQSRERIQSSCDGRDAHACMARERYIFIRKAIRSCVKGGEGMDKTQDGIDRAISSPLIGIPLFLLIMFAIFQLTFMVSAPFVEALDSVFGVLSEAIAGTMLDGGAPAWSASLVADGIIGGVGSILIFLPNIFILYILLFALGQSGYLSRVALVMDEIMRRANLPGKAFIPLILGFGCNVPGIMACRVLERKEDRLTTMLINPMMSCSARLPIYLIFVGAFFSKDEGMVLLGIYLLGIASAIISAWILRNTILRSQPGEFLIELPSFHLPSPEIVLAEAFDKTVSFIRKAGTVILAGSIMVWFLGNLPFGVEAGSGDSLAGIVGNSISPILSPLGFGNPESGVALIFGIMAKELVVESLGASYGVGETGLIDAVRMAFTPLSALSFMVFCLLYTPCLPALGAIRQESGGWKWALFSAAYSFAFAWIASFLIYQAGLWMGCS